VEEGERERSEDVDTSSSWSSGSDTLTTDEHLYAKSRTFAGYFSLRFLLGLFMSLLYLLPYSWRQRLAKMARRPGWESSSSSVKRSRKYKDKVAVLDDICRVEGSI